MKKTTLIIALCLFAQFMNSQNTCVTAIPITAGTHTVTGIDGVNMQTLCSNPTGAEWYSYTPTANYAVTISSDLLVNICKDTDFEVYTGSCDVGLVCYSGDDDGGGIVCNNGTNTFSYLSKKTFNVTAGVTYLIAWTNRYEALGFQFTLTEATFVPNPCDIATVISTGLTIVAPLTGGNITSNCSNATMSKWFSYTPTLDSNVTITSDLIQNICKNTNFSIYTGDCNGTLTCVTSDDNSGVIACNSGNVFSYLSIKTFIATAGVTYYIAWDNKNSADGFDFLVTETTIVRPIQFTTQTIPTINSTYKLGVCDMNGDFLDDIVGVSQNNLRVHNQGVAGALNFTDFPVPGTNRMPGWSLAAGDYNRDGFNDIVLGNGGGVSIWTSNNTGTAYSGYTPPEYIFCQRTNFVDLNNDGNLDIFSCHDVDPNCYYLNDENNNLTFYQSGITPNAFNIGIIMAGGNYASLFTDFDNDGDSDVFISKCSGPPCEMHRNDGNGVYTDISAIAGINVTPIQTWSSAIADFDNDGDMDIIITASANLHKYFRNELDTTNTTEEAFTNITAGSGWDTNTSTNIDNIAYDFDNDGFVDVLGGGNKIMFNQGNSTFLPVSYPGIAVGAIGDLNNDGFLDFLNGSQIRYAVPNANNWKKITLKGTTSNINGIGARVEIHGTWGKQIRDIRSGEGFKYMSSLNAHFGLGTATAITKIVVIWPSGTVDTINNPSINSTLHLIEGATLSTSSFADSNFSVYPNPVADVLNIALKNNSVQIKNIEIYDLMGRLIIAPENNLKAIDVRNLEVGTYVLMLKDSEGNQFSDKFIKK